MELLTDCNLNIRYLAAKNLAKMASNLPVELSDELLFTTFNLFEDNRENCYHGGCLCISEFCRKGLLNPELLPYVI